MHRHVIDVFGDVLAPDKDKHLDINKTMIGCD